MTFFTDSSSLIELKWDSEYFNVSCAKAILTKPLSIQEWTTLKKEFKEYQFVTIVNKNSDPVNSQLIGIETSGFLADVNIQFEKKIITPLDYDRDISIHQSFEKNDEVIEMAEFQFSRFKDDPNLSLKGGELIYRNWINNSFGKEDKYFAISRNKLGNLNGFALFSFQKNICVIELIAVDKKSKSKGIGRELIRSIEYEALSIKVNKIKVGTQLRNINAINFYQKVGFEQVSCDQIFHLWI